jgi:predicted nuclease of restriction endonuclease-like (RecB) superfamily
VLKSIAGAVIMKVKRMAAKNLSGWGNSSNGYDGLLGDISGLLHEARKAAGKVVNSIVTVVYWEIGRRIVEYEQGGEQRAEYGAMLLKRLASDLTARFGKGFGLSNLKLIRKFFMLYQERGKGQTPSGLSAANKTRISRTLYGLSCIADTSAAFRLTWSHYALLTIVKEKGKRDFYEEEAVRGSWSVRQLDRQINAMLFERVALSRKKIRSLSKAEHGGEGIIPEDAIKDPYVLEFLGLPESHSEKELENALIAHLAEFLLEMGYGFTFVARQKRLQIGSESFYLDLLLYHRRLRCLVAIELKIGRFTHADAGQMNMYLNYLRENETAEDEQAPIGLILCAEKDEAVAHYALGGLSNKVFASRYKLQLPDPAVLTREIDAERRRIKLRREP